MIHKNTQVHRVVLVTGSARRIGASIVKHLHQAGYSVAIHCHHSLAEAKTLSESLNQQRHNSAHVFVANLMQKTENQSLIAQVVAWAGRLDLLVNNASLFIPTNLTALDDAVGLSQYIMNVQAPLWLSIAAEPYLRDAQGCIINITDIHAENPLKGYVEYCQTKAALVSQTKALAQAFAPHVRVNAVAPGAIAWPEHENALSPAQQEKIISKTLLKRHGNAQYIAEAVLALVENSFITGQCLRVDGGRF